MSWIAVNWKISNDALTLFCYARSLSSSDERITLNFPCLDIIILDIPQSVGTPEESIITLSEIYCTSHVKHLSTSFYKVICTKEFTRAARPDTVRELYIVPTTVSSVLNAAGLSFNQHFDEDGRAIEAFQGPTSRRRIINWDLEVMIPKHGGFPTSQKDPIIMASFSADDEKRISIYTTIHNKYLTQVSGDIQLTLFKNELEMNEAILDKLSQYDVDVGYNTRHFDWPYLINRLLILKSPKIEDLTIKHLVVDSGRGMDYVISFDGMCDHVDLLPFARVAYSQFSDHKLDTITTNLLGVGKTGFSINKIRDITDQTLQPQSGEPTPELKDLVTKLVEYSAKDAEITNNLWNIVKPIYEYITDQTNIRYSEVGSGDEVDAILLKSNPELFLDKRKIKRIPSSYMDKGTYKNLNMYNIAPLLIQAMINSDDEITKKYGELLHKSFPQSWIVSPFFEMAKFSPKQIPEVTGTVGFSGGHIYTTNKIYGVPLVIYPVFIVISTGSWIIKNFNGIFSYHGLSAAARHPFKSVTRAIEKYINQSLEGKIPTDLSLFVSQLGDMDIDDITLTIKVTSLNINKYKNLISDSQAEAVMRSETPWINVPYVQVIESGVSIMKHVDQLKSDTEIDTSYYAKEILKILKKLP